MERQIFLKKLVTLTKCPRKRAAGSGSFRIFVPNLCPLTNSLGHAFGANYARATRRNHGCPAIDRSRDLPKCVSPQTELDTICYDVRRRTARLKENHRSAPSKCQILRVTAKSGQSRNIHAAAQSRDYVAFPKKRIRPSQVATSHNTVDMSLLTASSESVCPSWGDRGRLPLWPSILPQLGSRPTKKH